MNLAILMTCHNRRETTLRGLMSLYEAARPLAKTGTDWTADVFLVDDGSSDGTGQAVLGWWNSLPPNSSFTLHLIAGSGGLYWARGMALAWREALNREDAHRHFSHFLWLNDDTVLRPDAMTRMVALAARQPDDVAVGSLADESSGAKAYGVSDGGIFTGNFVLVPRGVYEQVGPICDRYRHAWADSDYAMLCLRAGVKVAELEDVGTTQAHGLRPPLKGLTFAERLRSLADPKGWCVHDLWLYRRRHRGLCAAVLSCAHLVCHVLKGER